MTAKSNPSSIYDPGKHGPRPDQLQLSSRLVSQLGGIVAGELRDDDYGRPGAECLTTEDLYVLARDAAHHGRVVLSAIYRGCGRCGDPLYSADDKLAGFCEACRGEFAALQTLDTAPEGEVALD